MSKFKVNDRVRITDNPYHGGLYPADGDVGTVQQVALNALRPEYTVFEVRVDGKDEDKDDPTFPFYADELELIDG